MVQKFKEVEKAINRNDLTGRLEDIYDWQDAVHDRYESVMNKRFLNLCGGSFKAADNQSNDTEVAEKWYKTLLLIPLFLLMPAALIFASIINGIDDVRVKAADRKQKPKTPEEQQARWEENLFIVYYHDQFLPKDVCEARGVRYISFEERLKFDDWCEAVRSGKHKLRTNSAHYMHNTIDTAETIQPILREGVTNCWQHLDI